MIFFWINVKSFLSSFALSKDRENGADMITWQQDQGMTALLIPSEWFGPLPADVSLGPHGPLEHYAGTYSSPDHLPLMCLLTLQQFVHPQASANSLVF